MSTRVELDRLVPLREAAEVLGVSKRTLHRLVARGELAPFVHVGASSRVAASELAAFIERAKRERGQ